MVKNYIHLYATLSIKNSSLCTNLNMKHNIYILYIIFNINEHLFPTLSYYVSKSYKNVLIRL